MQVVLYKKTGKMTSYYSLDDLQKGLFHPYVVTARWGSRPNGGRKKLYYFESEKEKNAVIRRLLQEKIQQNYRVLYNYFKGQEISDDSDFLIARG